jgi:hypothetical protein
VRIASLESLSCASGRGSRLTAAAPDRSQNAVGEPCRTLATFFAFYEKYGIQIICIVNLGNDNRPKNL